MPILVSNKVSVNLLPSELAKIHLVDYLDTKKNPIINLINSISHINSPGPLPNPLPPSPATPATPISNLSSLLSRIKTQKTLNPKQQNDILFDIKSSISKDQLGCIKLLNELKKRNDLNIITSKEVDNLLIKIIPKGKTAKKKIKFLFFTFLLIIVATILILYNNNYYNTNDSDYKLESRVPTYDTFDPEKQKAIDDFIQKSAEDTSNKI